MTNRVWDTPGDNNFRVVTKNIIQKAEAILIVYSWVDKASFDAISAHWIDFIDNWARSETILAIVSNKNDLEPDVPSDKGKSVAKENKLGFYEVSALEGTNISSLFESIATNLIAKKKGIFII